MSKAKEILEKLKDKVFMTEKGLVSFAPIIGEAIAELEALQQPKRCNGCKQSREPNNQIFHKYFCEYLKIPVHGDFCCNRYETKDIK